jgi:hypothetical protein
MIISGAERVIRWRPRPQLQHRAGRATHLSIRRSAERTSQLSAACLTSAGPACPVPAGGGRDTTCRRAASRQGIDQWRYPRPSLAETCDHEAIAAPWEVLAPTIGGVLAALAGGTLGGFLGHRSQSAHWARSSRMAAYIEPSATQAVRIDRAMWRMSIASSRGPLSGAICGSPLKRRCLLSSTPPVPNSEASVLRYPGSRADRPR